MITTKSQQNHADFDAVAFFRNLTEQNKLAQSLGFRFFEVSSLEGFHDVLSSVLTTQCLIAVSDTSEGSISYDNAPQVTRHKLVFLAMRHPHNSQSARNERFATMREIFRQFASVLLLEQTRLEQDNVFIDSDIRFHEIDKYFFSGCACAFFDVSVTSFTSMQFDPDQWLNNPLQQKTSVANSSTLGARR